jgi:inosine/xanthosine triphosphatase
MIRLVVASRNPVKVEAARLGFADLFGEGALADVQGIEAPSGVPDQPMGEAETLAGALNRARYARQAQPEADYWVGIEGGVARGEMGLEVFAWIAVLGQGRESRARTASFFLPPAIAAHIDAGMELGEADDLVFGKRDSKRQGGSVGLLTQGAITRTAYYRMAVSLAFIPFLNPGLYNG